jgi:hypothetical protein
MKRLLLLFILFFLLTHYAFAQITPIRNIQYTTDPSGNSPLKGQVVTISGIVTAEHRGTNAANGGISTSYFYMADSASAWGGVQIYYKGDIVAEGDSITVTGTVDEYSGQTELTNITAFERHAVRRPLPGPIDVTTLEAASEAYEGCLVRVNNVNIVEIDIGTYKNWKVDDGSGAIKVDTRAYYYFTPILNNSLKSLTGIIIPSSGEFTIAPRLAWDIVEAGEYTRIQRIQQVRNSDLLLAPIDRVSDMSYARLDTFKIKGVVTVPTGLSYAGAGIKFVLSEIGGGPWSGILSYHPDSTAYPTLVEGDVIEMTGYIDEYITTPGNMTEFWITSPINILDFGQPTPVPDTIKTGDLRLPVTAEQWGNVMVVVKDVVVTNVNPPAEPYGIMAVDDGTGEVWVDHDSYILNQWWSAGNTPPRGTIFESIRGWAYHHYGDYGDSSTYKLVPSYLRDLVFGAAPPKLSRVLRNPTVPLSSDDVELSVDIQTNSTIASAEIYYSVNGGAYQTSSMSVATGNTWVGAIPKQADGTWVDYFVKAVDVDSRSSLMPSDTSLIQYNYIVKDAGLTISDIQYTPWPLADSPFEGSNVIVKGIVTTDTMTNVIFGAYTIQDGQGPWDGIFIFGVYDLLSVGDEVQVWGTVTDYNADYHYKWDNNTVILVDSLKLLSSGNVINPIEVPTASLSAAHADVESYEGLLVKIKDATLMSINRYDVTFDDGSGPCLVDGDFMLARDQDENDIFYVNDDDGYLFAFGDTLRPGDKVAQIQGIFTYSFGTYKIEIRNSEDFGLPVGVNPNYEPIALTYKLKQNFPNPFNPETRIYFEIPQSHQVKIVIYNVLGQQVRTLINEHFNPGYHVINWDGRDNSGNVVPSGVYIYRIKAGEFIASKKMIMMK